MKKFFLLLACVATYIAACTMTVNAQTKMHIWMQGGNIPFELASVDSVTFSGYAQEEFTISETSLSLYVGESYQLTANKPVDQWASSAPSVVTVTDGFVTAVSEGTAIIAATAGNQTRTCVVKVIAPIEEEHPVAVKGSQIWPIIMDNITYEANESKVVAYFKENDVDQFLYVWEGTYLGGEATGLNAMGNREGYISLTVGTLGWSGAGFNLDENAVNMAKCRELRDAIVANPDDYFLHMAIKSTDQGSHTFYVLNSDRTKFVMGTPFDGGTAVENFTRDGKWHHYDIPMAQYANALASADLTKGANVFVMLSGGTAGVELNLDAVYFYKKGTSPDQPKGTITVTPKTLNLSVGDEVRLSATINPAPTTSVKLNWVSSDPAVATVLNGVVKAEGFGTAKIILFADGYTADTCVVNVNNDAVLDNYQLNSYGLFGSPTMMEGTEREVTMTSGATYKCQLGYINLYAWDNNITFVNGSGFSGKGYFFQTEVAIWWIVEGDHKGYYVGNSSGFHIALNPQDTIALYSGKGGELVDLQKYGDCYYGMVAATESTTDAEYQALYQLYVESQTGTQIFTIDWDNNAEQSYNLGNVTAAHFYEDDANNLQYTITIDWYDHVNDDRLYGLLVDEAGENIVKPYDMRTIHKEYTNIVETPAAAPAKKAAKAAVLGNPERLHLDANYAVEQVNNMKAKVQLHK